MKKILIIDEGKRIIEYLKEELQNTYGFDVLWLKSGVDVIKTIKNTQFDAIILDIMIPIPQDWSIDEQRRSENGLSTGLVLFEKIRSINHTIPILIYSAKGVNVIDKYTIALRKPEMNNEIVKKLNILMNYEK